MSNEFTDDKLQQLFDGDLSEGEAARLQAALEASPEHQRQLESLERLHRMIGIAADDVSADLDSDALFARIETGVKEESGGRVLSLNRARRRRQITTAVFAVGLAAAAAMAVLWDSSINDRSGHVAGNEPRPGSEVEEVDFGANMGTVFAVEGTEGEPIAVVWITDEEIP